MGFRENFKQVDPAFIVVKKGLNPRIFDTPEMVERLATLKASIAEVGVQKALTVYIDPKDENQYVLMGGETRLRAVRELNSESPVIKRVPIEIKDAPKPEDAVFFSLLDNQGKPLTQLESGQGFKKLLDYGWTVEEIANKVGVTKNYVTRAIELHNLPAEVKTMVANGEVTGVAAIKQVRDAKGDTESAAAVLAARVAEVNASPSPKASDKPVPVKNVRVTKESKLSELVTELFEWSQANGLTKAYNQAINQMPIGSSEIPDSVIFAVPIDRLMKVFGKL